MIETQKECRPVECEFFEKLEKLDRGDKAKLKRNAGNSLAEARGVAWFYGKLPPGVKERDYERYFMVATLYCIGSNTHKLEVKGNLGVTLGALKLKASEDAIKRRFNILLDADIDNGGLAFRLRQLVKLAASHGVGIDWPQLLEDICRWSSPKKSVQRSWARSFYTPELTGMTENEGEKDAN